jgi:glucokinase
MKLYLGVDLGGTNLKAGIVNPDTGEMLVSRSVPTVAREGPAAVMARMAELIEGLISSAGLAPAAIGGIGIGVPGALNLAEGTTRFLPNLPGNWPNVPLAAVIQEQTGLPVSLLNDVRAITFGEWRFGAGRGVDTLACFAIGTGIGGGLIINGQLHLGIGGTAGELGHQTIDLNGPACGCGNRGCLEALASGPAIAAMGMKAVTQGRTTVIGALVNYDLNRITPEVICAAAAQGDAVGQEIYAQVGTLLGVAIANVLITVGPRKVVLAGGVAAAGELLLRPVRQTIRERVFLMPADQVDIVLASLGSEAGVLGAAAWANQSNRLTV